MEKDCLIPVATKPAANLLLETFSRENSAAQSRRSSAAAARESRYKSVPKIGSSDQIDHVVMLLCPNAIDSVSIYSPLNLDRFFLLSIDIIA